MNKLSMFAKVLQSSFFYTVIVVLMGMLSLHVSVSAEEKAVDQTVSINLMLSEKKCTLAIWLTDAEGVFIDTVYVTRKVAQKGLGNRGGALDDKWGGSRLSTLPVWANTRGVDYGSDNFYPPKDKPLPDVITSATPKAGKFIWNWNPKDPLKQGRYFYYIEVNKSFDKNDNHDYSWYRGQPSVIWKGSFSVGDKFDESEAEIVGHGDIAGRSGQIFPDTTTLTSSLNLIEKATASFQP